MLKEPFPLVGGYNLAHYLPSNELNLLECDHLDVQEHNHDHHSSWYHHHHQEASKEDQGDGTKRGIKMTSGEKTKMRRRRG